MKKTLALVLLLACTVVQAQTINTEHKARKAKAAMLKAFGGETALKAISHFDYTIIRTDYSGDTTFTRTNYTLDLNHKYVRETRFTATDTVTSWISAEGAWLLQNGKQTELPQQDKERLQRVFLTNFIPMLRDNSLTYLFKERTKYKSRTADIIQVYTYGANMHVMDLFVDTRNGRILTSSRPDAKTGIYTYFADELDYQPIGEGIVFPLVYQIWVNGKLLTVGKFENVQIK
ncbi:hypothetical protein WG947_04690 [Pontibacter sp. H259]|uniref:hypothetical protein n=1 Tax=Pontibacter sp. H259 TaxID=3133421 RepID=UPI0030BDF409